MRPVAGIVAVLACAAVAVATMPAARASTALDSTPWPVPVVRAASLGRVHAAADVAWLKTVQLIGSDAYGAANWPHLERWIDLITTLDASFEEPYFFGAALLVTDRARAPAVDRVLARGEEAFPDVYALSLLRGFLAQFGLFDSKLAAERYRDAARKPGAPPYLAQYAARLEREGASCGSVLSDLRQLASSSSSDQARAIEGQRGVILEHCFRDLIERTSVALRLERGKPSTLEDVEKELGAQVPHPPGRCWKLDHDRAELVPCPASQDAP